MKRPVLDVESMREAALEATAVMQVLANPNRLLLLCQLTQGEHSVGELEEALEIRQPTLSQQLGVLRNEELVSTRRDGKQVIYAIADERVAELLRLVHALYCPR